ncbi:hypothetical protein EPUL_004968 [Erysiphe pulchra]|uniref:DH domain-containing protein n=1 Tax=Erysiphe pulchra TaxID=225359 RepID=A0A2S4Q022_9PEZI|nr:hypothetical protein EPUL_004968 [Erysiphe pulchra]
MQQANITEGHKRDSSATQTPTRQSQSKEIPIQGKLKSSGPATKLATTKSHRRTPNRPLGKYGTSHSAPLQQKAGGRRMEPTLFENFLLGRTGSPRARRTAPLRRISLEMVKADMKSEFVSKLQEPGKVKDRVRKWQMSSAVYEGTTGIGEENEQNSKARQKEGVQLNTESRELKPRTPEKTTTSYREKSNYTDREAVQDWIGKTEFDGLENLERPYSNASQVASSDLHESDDAGEIFTLQPTFPSPTKNVTASNLQNNNDKVKTEKHENNLDDCIGVRSLSHQKGNLNREYALRAISDEVEIGKLNEDFGKTIENSKSNLAKMSASTHKTQPLDPENGSKASRIKEQISVTSKSTNSRINETHDSQKMKKITKNSFPEEEKDSNKLTSSFRNRKCESQRNRLKVRSTSLNEIPFGNSAFSVLDLPLGAEAETIKKSSSKRNSSLTVPNVLKMVYGGSKKIVSDAAEPRRSDLTQPASIESWLRTTSDPFVDSSVPPISTFKCPASYDGNTSSSKITQTDSKATNTCKETAHLSKGRKPNTGRSTVLSPLISSKLPEPPSLRSVPSIELKRSRARRHAFTTSSSKMTPIKESIFNAFHGESTMKKPSKTKSCDTSSLKEKKIEILDSNLKTSRPKPTSESAKTQDQILTENSTSELNVDEAETSTSRHQRPIQQFYTHGLSTILSEGSSNSSSLGSRSESIISQNTVTQDTIHTVSTHRSLSRKSQRKQLKSPELKRRLTKHSDLISILSLSDTSEPGRQGSIRAARSIQMSKKQNFISSIEDVLIELAEDELQYMRELETLIDGVIPVLLRCIFSESNASGLFGYLVTNAASFSRPIIEMGNALVKIQSHHKCIPLADAYALLIWADSVQAVYEEYLLAWNSGFEDIVVNLAPALSCTKTAMDEMKRDRNGDLLGEKGEKIVVDDLLKKPITRIKYINKALKASSQFQKLNLIDFPSTCEEAKRICSNYETLLNLRKNRIKEENARKVDRQAWSANTSRARNFKSLDRAGPIEINHQYQVIAKDCFSFEMLHSTGQRINCSVELVLRNLPSSVDEGDLLIFKDDSKDPFLLFEPIPKNLLSARLGNTEEQVIVMVNDSILGEKNAQFLILDATTERIAADWISMLGEQPIPPPITRAKLKINPELDFSIPNADFDAMTIIQLLDEQESDQVPIGEPASEELAGLTLTQKNNRQENHLLEFRDPSETLKKLIDIKEFESKTEGDDSSVYAPKSWSSSNEQGSNSLSLSTKTNLQIERPCKSMNEIIQSKVDLDIEEKNLDSQTEQTTLGFRDDGAPPPPVHKTLVSGNSTSPDIIAPRGKIQLISSPLKYEYQPSDSSDSSSEGSVDTDSCMSSLSEEISDDEMDDEKSEKQSNIHSKRLTDPNTSLSNVNVQIDRDSLPTPQFPVPLDLKETYEHPSEQFFAVLSQWNGLAGKWLTLSNETLVQVMDGLIECFTIDTSTGFDTRKSTEEKRSILKQTLTSEVQVRQSTAIDIEIKSAISFTKDFSVSSSPLKVGDTLRYRLSTPSACDAFYAAVNRLRLRNKEYLELEEHNKIKKAELQLYTNAMANSRRRYLFGIGRKKSYRASTRVQNNRDVGKLNMAMTALQRLSGAAGLFNISRSWVEYSSRDNNSSYGGSSYQSNYTPPRTAGSLADNSDSLHSSGLTVRNLGTSNILTRLYYLLRNGNWLDQGQAFLTVSVPPSDMKQKAPLYNGPQKRITVTKNPIPVSEVVTSADIQKSGLMLDEVLGANLFVRMQKSGIMLQTWEDVSGEEGRGGVRSFGSVAPKRHTWALQFRRSGDTEWCWQLCRSGIP